MTKPGAQNPPGIQSKEESSKSAIIVKKKSLEYFTYTEFHDHEQSAPVLDEVFSRFLFPPLSGSVDDVPCTAGKGMHLLQCTLNSMNILKLRYYHIVKNGYQRNEI